MEDHVVAAVIGGAASLIGVGGLVWKFALSHAKNHQDHARIISLLETMGLVESRLDDVLKHPDDTVFSVEPVKKELVLIHDKLKEIDEKIRKLM